MKHNLKISISKEPLNMGGIARCKTVTLRERLLKMLFGEMRRVMVIVPGDRVDCLSIQEVQEEGDADERA